MAQQEKTNTRKFLKNDSAADEAVFIDHLLNSTTAGLSVVDRNYKLVRLNGVMRGLLRGVTSLEYHQGDSLLKDEMADEMKVRWKSVMDRCFAGESLNYKVSYPIGDRMHHFETWLNPYEANGEVQYVVNTSTDVTDALSLDQTERRYNALIERSLDIKALVDANGITLYRSPASERILGHSDDRIVGSSAFQNIYPDDLPLAQTAFREAMLKPGEPVSFHFRIFHKEGREVNLEGTIVNLLNEPEVQALVVNAQDVTERKEAEREREKIAADLVQRVKDLEQFAYIVSHNLRSPVANILGIANALQVGVNNDAMHKQLLNGIFNATRRLDDVLHDLNDVLDVQQKINEKKESVRLSKLVNDIGASIDHIVRAENVSLTYDFTAVDSLFTIRSYLHSIFYNLITNSVKYRRPGVPPVIHISGERVDGNIKFHFTDNGLGMDLTKNGNQLFGLYKRFHDHTDGKGMGLYMVKTQVDALGGTVTAESKPNEGMRFTISFPE